MNLAEKEWKKLTLEEFQKTADILLLEACEVRNGNEEYVEERTFSQCKGRISHTISV